MEGVMRTRTYIAGDWTGDQDAIKQLHKYNEDAYWGLHFVDAHDFKQARDTSLNCSIKKSLKDRLDHSKTFILIVGENTNNLRAGCCTYCDSYNSWGCYCARGYSVDYRSFVEYECEEAVAAGIKIVVLYNSTIVDKSKCPIAVRNKGNHVPMIYRNGYKLYWDYYAIVNAVCY